MSGSRGRSVVAVGCFIAFKKKTYPLKKKTTSKRSASFLFKNNRSRHRHHHNRISWLHLLAFGLSFLGVIIHHISKPKLLSAIAWKFNSLSTIFSCHRTQSSKLPRLRLPRPLGEYLQWMTVVGLAIRDGNFELGGMAVPLRPHIVIVHVMTLWRCL